MGIVAFGFGYWLLVMDIYTKALGSIQSCSTQK